MASDKQINANRLNGKKGGPKTPAGRAAVRHNALKHGLSAEHPVLSLEELSVFEEYLAQLRQEFQPIGIMEQMLVDQIADAYWRRQRIVCLEVGLFDTNNANLKERIEETYTGVNSDALLHLLAEHDAKGPDMLGRYYRYDAHFERSFFRAWKELKALQAARKAEVQTKPEPEYEPEIPETKKLATDSAKQTQKEPAQPASGQTPDPEPPEAAAEKPENDDNIM